MGDKGVTKNWTSTATGIQKAANNILWDASANLFWDNDMNTNSTSLHPQDGNSWAVLSGLVDDTARAVAISNALQARWVKPYGAPAPEAGDTVSPFASGFEIQAHYYAGHAERAVELIEFMWADFMLDDPRMTNSTFIEGYSTNGSLHYAPYQNDPRVSHAHGWATGPTSTLTFLAAGVRLTSAAGKTWQMEPSLGGLGSIEAGYVTPLGSFSASWTVSRRGWYSGKFEVPRHTSGTLVIPASVSQKKLIVKGPKGKQSIKVRGKGSKITIPNLPGGKYTVHFE